MNLYVLETSINGEAYHVVAETMDAAGDKLKSHLKESFDGTFRITNCRWVCGTPNNNTLPTCKYQYKLVL